MEQFYEKLDEGDQMHLEKFDARTEFFYEKLDEGDLFKEFVGTDLCPKSYTMKNTLRLKVKTKVWNSKRNQLRAFRMEITEKEYTSSYSSLMGNIN